MPVRKKTKPRKSPQHIAAKLARQIAERQPEHLLAEVFDNVDIDWTSLVEALMDELPDHVVRYTLSQEVREQKAIMRALPGEDLRRRFILLASEWSGAERMIHTEAGFFLGLALGRELAGGALGRIR